MWADAELAKVWLVTPLPWATGCAGAWVNFRAGVHLAQSPLPAPPLNSKLRMMLAGPREIDLVTFLDADSKQEEGTHQLRSG